MHTDSTFEGNPCSPHTTKNAGHDLSNHSDYISAL